MNVLYSTSKDKLRTLAQKYGTKIADYKENERITFWKFSNHEMFDKIKQMFVEHNWFPANISVKLTKKQRKVFTYSNEDLEYAIENYSNFSIKFVSEFKILKLSNWPNPMFLCCTKPKANDYCLNGIQVADFENSQIPVVFSIHHSYNIDEHLNELLLADLNNYAYVWFRIPKQTPYFTDYHGNILLLQDIPHNQVNIVTSEMIEKYY